MGNGIFVALATCSALLWVVALVWEHNHSSGTNDAPLAWLEPIPGCPMIPSGDLGQITSVCRGFC